MPCGSSEIVHARFRKRWTPPIPDRAPRPALVPRAHEHQEQANRVRAVPLHQLVGVLHVAARLRHALAVGAQDLALVEHPLPRFVLLDQPDVAHHLRELAGVEQVHHGVLRPAGVLLDGRPRLDRVSVDRTVGLVRRQVAIPVPGRVDEGVHRVRLALRRLAVDWARNVEECLVTGQRVHPTALVVDGVGQEDRQVLVGDGHDAVRGAMDHGDRRAPVALAADQPVA